MKSYRIKLLCLLFICFYLKLIGEEKPIVISLGDHCPVAITLRHHGIRTHAYPFDWVVTPFSSLYKVLDENFSNFFLKENLSHGLTPFLQVGILDTYTGIYYLHDFPITESNSFDINLDLNPSGTVDKGFLNYYDAVRAKHLRRIDRLREVLNSSAPVILIRHAAKREEAIALRDLLQIKYPNLNFTLAVINTFDSYHQTTWDEAKIKNYYLPLPALGDPNAPEWLYILFDLQLLP